LSTVSYITTSTPGNTVDGTIAAVVLPCVKPGGNDDPVESHNNDVDDANGTVL